MNRKENDAQNKKNIRKQSGAASEKTQEMKSGADTPLESKMRHEKSPESSHGVTSIFLPVLNKDEYKTLEESVAHLDSYHGYICRPDLPLILKSYGDFVIRVKIHQDRSDLRKTAKRGGGGGAPKEAKSTSCPTRDLVVSVYGKEPTNPGKSFKPRPLPIVNMAIRRSEGKYCIEMKRKFNSIAELLAAYKTETGIYRAYEFQLLKGCGLTKWEFNHSEIKLLDRKLGEGAFGEVRVGEIKIDDKTIEVAVKTLKNAENLNREQVAELLHEGRIMRQLDHVNVLRSYGVAVLQEPLYLMSEVCGCGALREYLKKNAKTITMAERIGFCLGSAKGVEYLHTQNLIHRDLAVRNVFLTDDKTPKVSDFGLAKKTDRYEMKEACKVPVRYLAPETLDTFVFTQKSDVFSFGMVIWEIFENGTQPHDGKNARTIRGMSKQRQFLKVSENAPDEVKKLVSDKIFVSDPENRCNMSVVVQILEKITVAE